VNQKDTKRKKGAGKGVGIGNKYLLRRRLGQVIIDIKKKKKKRGGGGGVSSQGRVFSAKPREGSWVACSAGSYDWQNLREVKREWERVGGGGDNAKLFLGGKVGGWARNCFWFME